MASWLLKAIVQRGIGALPNPHYWNGLLQDRLTHSTELTDERFAGNLRNCENHLEHLCRYGSTASSFSAFEIGTGWWPVVPIGLFLCGAREVWIWDIAPHLNLDSLKATIRRFLEFEQRQKLQDYLLAIPERLLLLREVAALCESREQLTTVQLLERLGIHYRVGNACRSGLPPQSINLIVSVGVLQHFSPEQLFEILQEFRRIAAPDAVSSHWMNLTDLYSAFDSGITPFHFLRFSDRQWRWLNNPVTSMNRLRVSDYRRAFSESGFQIVEETSVRGDPAELARTPLASRFRDYSVEDLLVLHTWLVAVLASGDGRAP